MGRRPRGIKLEKTDLRKLYIKESRSVRDIAGILGCSKDMVYRALKEYDIQRRKHVQKRSQLKDYDFADLKRKIRLKGYNKVARELGVHNTTLRRFIEKGKAQR